MDENSKPETNNQSNTILIVTFVILLLIVSGVVYYLIKPREINPESSATSNEEITETTGADETPATLTQPEDVQEQTKQDEITTTDNTTDNKNEIDSDLQSLDDLDLSSPENDYGDDKISDL